MSPENMGQFIAQLRKSRDMTQRELAEKLQITDKAVSKWERGLSCPDISLLSPLAEILGVTVSELLNGRKSAEGPREVKESVDIALRYAGRSVSRRMKRLRAIGAASFSLALFLGILVCAVCDLTVSGGFTWSIIPTVSILFAWLVLFPLAKWGKRGIPRALLSLSVFLLPYLWALDSLIAKGRLLPIGMPVALPSLAYVWIAYFLFRFLQGRRLLAAALTVLLAIPLSLSIDVILSRLLGQPVFDRWDALSCLLLAVLAMALIVYDRIARKNRK